MGVCELPLSSANPLSAWTTPVTSAPIQRSKSLHEQVYEAVRTRILSGQLRPGERLVETQLAQELQVSRTPLREALRKLQQEGLLAAEVGGGLRVATLSIQDAIELYDCRLALEGFAIAAACQQATPDQLEAMETWVLAAEADTTGDPVRLLDVDYGFHHAIAAASGNGRLVILLDQLFDAMALLRIQTLQHNPKVLNIRLEHRAIWTAIAQRDPAAATAAIQAHLLASKTRVVKEIESFQQRPHSVK
jgi:DNA-binding GntR family transcriptional regulator